MNITKKTAFGATAAAAALVVIGAAAPAMASEGHSTSNKWYSSTSTQHTDYTTVVAPDVSVLNGDILDGNSVGSGNELNAPIASGNETAIGNGVGNGSGNVTGNGSGNSASDLVDNATNTSVSDLVDVNDVISDISGWVDLSNMFKN